MRGESDSGGRRRGDVKAGAEEWGDVLSRKASQVQRQSRIPKLSLPLLILLDLESEG